ncbi:hypothetical protein SAMN05216304_1011050 [Bosea sp. OK403]|uniref:hypothetical protein n=1 Tax=Bosea sp. OK403 TaxID=1855286 RepID=UPI0008E7BEF9|nr:hypothetical protein [Bosea sp. OK403]SFI13818.1 hypothetical protein SAMN05216304_1011050 [Bosea sp. OK403]
MSHTLIVTLRRGQRPFGVERVPAGLGVGCCWAATPADSGFPTFRHSVFGMHVCLTVGLPDEVAHTAVGHSFEGQHMGVSAECTIVRQADHGWWHVAGALGLIKPETMAGLAANLTARKPTL